MLLDVKNHPKTQVHFLQIADNAQKMLTLCTLAQKHFYAKEKMLICVPTDEAAAYIDLLLWRMPEESFIPHEIANPAKITIAKSTENINEATILINLGPQIPINLDAFACIYELYDKTHPSKVEQAEQKLAAYRDCFVLPILIE